MKKNIILFVLISSLILVLSSIGVSAQYIDATDISYSYLSNYYPYYPNAAYNNYSYTYGDPYYNIYDTYDYNPYYGNYYSYNQVNPYTGYVNTYPGYTYPVYSSYYSNVYYGYGNTVGYYSPNGSLTFSWN